MQFLGNRLANARELSVRVRKNVAEEAGASDHSYWFIKAVRDTGGTMVKCEEVEFDADGVSLGGLFFLSDDRTSTVRSHDARTGGRIDTLHY